MAFTEACLLACFLERPLHFLVRGDVFKKSWRWFFKFTHQIPIYRFRDGFANMRKNSDSFTLVYEALSQDCALLIFAEGNTKMQKKLSPLQKGAARISFGCLEKYPDSPLQIVPVGINYSDGLIFRSNVMIQIGSPISVQSYWQDYLRDPQLTIRKLTNDLFEKMLPLVIHIDHPEDEPMVNAAIAGTQLSFKPWPIIDSDPQHFITQKEIAKQVNQLDREGKSLFKTKLLAQSVGSIRGILSWWQSFLLALIFPFALLGFVINAIPFFLAKSVAQMKVTTIEFFTPVRITLMIVFYGIYSLLVTLCAILMFGWYGLWILPILFISGYLTVIWFDLWSFRQPLEADPKMLALLDQK